MKSAISIKNLRKSYGRLEALKGVNLDIQEGEIFGLLGRNGAGKTTTINILTGFVKLEHGEVKVFNHDVVKDYRITRKFIGIASQEFTLDLFFTVRNILEYQAGYYGLTKKVASDRVDFAISVMDLKAKEYVMARTLSGGLKRRLMIAKALVHNPKILILDEPTAGVDVDLRRQIWKLIKKLKSEGITILLTTHYIEEAELLCDRIAIIDDGKIIAINSPAGLIGNNTTSTISLKLRNMSKIPKQLEKFSPKLRRNELVLKVKNSSVIQEVSEVLTKNNVEIMDLRLKHKTLEDEFINLTGRRIDE